MISSEFYHRLLSHCIPCPKKTLASKSVLTPPHTRKFARSYRSSAPIAKKFNLRINLSEATRNQSERMPDQDLDLEECLKVAIQAGRDAGELIRKAWDQARTVEHKGAVDLVTETDKECEALVLGQLKGAFPSHKFIGEEETAAMGFIPELTDEPTWLVDPVDGTTNFVHRFPFCCVSIALSVNSKVVVGVVYNPMLNELFHAKDESGAFLNGKAIHCSGASDLKSSIFITELGTRRDKEYMDAVFSRMKIVAEHTRGMRSCGSCALNLCSVACGRADAYYEIGLGGPWDMAAGSKILEEAGGVVSDPIGSPVSIMSRRILGTNSHLGPLVASILSKAPCLDNEPQPK